MKYLIGLVSIAFASTLLASDLPSKPEVKKPAYNCVTKDKKGNCPAEPKSKKPTPKKKTQAK